MNQKNKVLHENIVLIVLYIFSHGIILLNDGLYWDDWALKLQGSKRIIDLYLQQGTVWAGYIHSFLFRFSNPFLLYRLIVLFAYGISVFLFDRILSKVTNIDKTSRFFLVAFFAFLPLNSARITLICLPYAICNLVFFCGSFFLVKYLEKPKLILRMLAICMFFFSFFTQSLLVFYSIPFLLILYKNRSRINTAKSFFFNLFRYIDFVFLPFFFWILKKTFWNPYGIYSGYLSFRTKTIIKSPLLLIETFNASFFGVLDASFLGFSSLILVITVCVVYFLRSNPSFVLKDSVLQNKRELFFYLLFGIIAFFFGALAYNVLGIVPADVHFDSRHQLLLPIGASFMLFYSCLSFSRFLNLPRKAIQFALWLLIVLFINQNLQYYIQYQKDWFKQVSIVENIKNSEIFEKNTTFLFRDEYKALNINERAYFVYEFTGWMKEAFSDETRFGVDENNYSSTTDIEYYIKKYGSSYLLSDYVMAPPDYLVIIQKGTYDVDSIWSFFHLNYLKLFDRVSFMERVSRIVKLNYQKIESGDWE